jgi:hypothetical protein
VRPLEVERGDEAGERVGELRRSPAIIDVRGLAKAGGVPRDDSVVSCEIGNHPLPRAAVAGRAVQHDKGRPGADACVADP